MHPSESGGWITKAERVAALSRQVQENLATYNNPGLPIAPELVGMLATFMK